MCVNLITDFYGKIFSKQNFMMNGVILYVAHHFNIWLDRR